MIQDVDVVKDKRTGKNNDLEFLIGCHDFPNPIHDTWGSENMIREFNKKWEEDYRIKISGKRHFKETPLGNTNWQTT